MNHKYINRNGDCAEADNFYPMTAVDESGVAGHLILRYTDAEKKVIRFGFVIVDDAKRGMGYGKEMLRLALTFAFEVLCAEKVTLGVFEHNAPAYGCYKAVGFRDVQMEQPEVCEVCGERWRVLELAMTKAEYQA